MSRIWEMLRDRNDMTHFYNGDSAKHLVEKILETYIPEFQRMKCQIDLRYKDILSM